MLQSETAKRMFSRINDSTTHEPDYYAEEPVAVGDAGSTSHLSVLAANGDAVSVTSTINTL